jgi:hypothetical protein
MKNLIHSMVLVVLLATSSTTFISCANMGGASGVITSAQAWLNDPAHQAEINAIANTIITIVGALGEKKATTNATVVGKVATQYPNVPAGAIVEIAKNPHAYVKK